MIKLQVNMQGFHGKGCSLFGAYDQNSGILVIAKFTSLKKRQAGCILISSDSYEDYDSLFDIGSISSAIKSYQYLKSKQVEGENSFCLKFSPSAMQADPSSSIELDGVDGNGSKYRINIDASNTNIAALAMCDYVHKSIAINDVLDMMGELDTILNGGVITL